MASSSIARPTCLGVGYIVATWLAATAALAMEAEPDYVIVEPPDESGALSPPAEDGAERRDWAVLHAGFRPRLGTFGGLATLALVDGDIERFYGGLRFSFVKDSATRFTGGVQLAPVYAEASAFTGALQLGSVARTRQGFTGGLQLGVVSLADGEFNGLVQAGAVVGIGRMFEEYEQVTCAQTSHDFTGLLQVGLAVSTRGRFIGLAQVGGVVWTGGDMYAPFQLGLVAIARDFRGIAQIGLLSGGDESVHGATIGVLVAAPRLMGAQLAGVTFVDRQMDGLQLGVVNIVASGKGNGAQIGIANVARIVYGAQMGAANVAGEVRGAQIGLVNVADHLDGIQIGLLNRASSGAFLPWSALVNLGF
ncbi:MAG: hypothetical protein JW751_01660 [Polyangiaceae bacterium]|nr:hypothetical protein [Polyangiaceae bacterium]